MMHGMKKIGWTAVILGAIVILSMMFHKEEVKESEKPAGQMQPFKVVLATDLHYLAPSLQQGSPFFHQLMDQADGKITEYSEEMLDSFIIEMLKEKPDVVALSGDLTFNGEKISHQRLSDKLMVLKENGIKVCVIPGNHDLNSRTAVKFNAEGYDKTESVDAAAFETIYKELGYGEAIARDAASLSYIAEIRDNVWMICLDTNVKGHENEVTAETLKWLKNVLHKAEQKGVKIIGMSHQNLHGHNEVFTDGFQIKNADKLAALYEKYGVSLNLSGHMHIQHIKENGKITEIANSALTVAPCQYGELSYDGTSIKYETKKLQLKKIDAADYFKKVGAYKTKIMLEADGISENEKQQMLTLFMEVNYAYFSGRMDQMNKESMNEGYALWKQYAKGTFSFAYLESILKSEWKDQNKYETRW